MSLLRDDDAEFVHVGVGSFRLPFPLDCARRSSQRRHSMAFSCLKVLDSVTDATVPVSTQMLRRAQMRESSFKTIS